MLSFSLVGQTWGDAISKQQLEHHLQNQKESNITVFYLTFCVCILQWHRVANYIFNKKITPEM